MFNKILRTMGRVTRTDLIIILTVNVIVGCYIWVPYIKEVNSAKKSIENEASSISKSD
jgi:hypothetical protein